MAQVLKHLFLHLIFLGVVVRRVVSQDQCLPTRCGAFGPLIRFPFHLKHRQPTRCGYPGFELTCTEDNITQFKLQIAVWASSKNIKIPISATVSIQEIDYKSQTIKVGVSDFNASCLPRQIPNTNSSTSSSSFTITTDEAPHDGFILFNCSSNKEHSFVHGQRITCLSGPQYDILAYKSSSRVYLFPPCKKMYNISFVPQIYGSSQIDGSTSFVPQIYGPTSFVPQIYGSSQIDGSTSFVPQFYGFTSIFLHWSEPFPRADGPSKYVIVASVLGSVSAFVSFVIAVYKIVLLKIKKEDQKRIERLLEDYKALRPTRYTYTDIKKITEQLKHKLGQGGYGKVYKGKLSNEILVAVKVLNNFKGDGAEFINEVGTIGRIHHVNVVRLVGYCADGYRRALVYEYLPNDTLQKIISGNVRGSSLGWEKMQQIAVGIAKGIEYLHQGCNQRIVHFDIKPHNILLDEDFNPKVADFGLAKLCSKDQSAVSMTAARGTIGYIAPEVFSRNYGNVSFKADIYSFGMLLLDMIGGRKKFKAANEENNSSEIYYPEWMFKQLEKGEEIAIQIENEDDSFIMKKLAIVGLWCIQWYPADRPSMKVVIQTLEGEGIPIMPPNPFGSMDPTDMRTITEGSQWSSELGSSFEAGASSN